MGLSEPNPGPRAEPGPSGLLARVGRSLKRDLLSKTFLTGLGEQLIRGAQAILALTGIDTYLKSADAALDFSRAGGAITVGCIMLVIGLYLKARGDRS